MANFLKFPRGPQCFSCLRNFPVPEPTISSPTFRIQLRGKKKLRLPTTINVKLVRDVRGYGRKGSIVPVAPGRMRNIWYPGKRAEYVTAAQLRGMDDVVIERDFTFGMEKEVEAQEALKDDTAVEMQLLAPQRATELLDSLVPQYLDFYRPPIRTPEPEQDTTLLRTRTAASQAAADFAAASAPDPKPVPISIYGSVSTADIATNIKVALAPKVAYDADVGRIVLSAEDIKLSHDDETAEDQERIKTLGDFQVDITVKGGQAVRRTVRVKAQQ